MSPRLPSARAGKPIDALDYEIAQEMAGALGRLGRALERALQALAEFDATAAAGNGPSNQGARDTRRRLTVEAGHALWLFIVQREACGLRDSRQIMRDYRVPPEVGNRIGAFP